MISIPLLIRIFFIVMTSMAAYSIFSASWLGGVVGLIVSLGLVVLEIRLFPQPEQILKILDTSVIIDGRIADVGATGFLEGTVLVPGFVLNELQRIADSSDALKRNRGRRGLDTLATLQRQPGFHIIIGREDFPGVTAVDEKLIKLAVKTKAQILTHDLNLSKIANLQGIRVLNINDLTNAVKTVVLPGEELSLKIIKEGKEPGQGVGYLDDGTMVVVENGRGLVNQRVAVLVTSALQTAAGRMIFARQKSAGE